MGRRRGGVSVSEACSRGCGCGCRSSCCPPIAIAASVGGGGGDPPGSGRGPRGRLRLGCRWFLRRRRRCVTSCVRHGGQHSIRRDRGSHPRIHCAGEGRRIVPRMMHRLLHRLMMMHRRMRRRLLVVAGPLGGPSTAIAAHSGPKHLAYDVILAIGRGWRVGVGSNGAFGSVSWRPTHLASCVIFFGQIFVKCVWPSCEQTSGPLKISRRKKNVVGVVRHKYRR